MKHCISGQKVRVFFPHLVTTLCKKVRVLMEENEKFMKPTKILIGDPIYTLYVELHRKQIINWNQQKKNKKDGRPLLFEEEINSKYS